MMTQCGQHRSDDVRSTHRWTKQELHGIGVEGRSVDGACITLLALLLFVSRHAAFRACIIVDNPDDDEPQQQDHARKR